MGDSIAQQVFQRCGHALQHVAIQFAVRTIQLQLDLLAGIGSGLSQHATQAWHQPIERHHARTHQAILQLGTDA